MVEGRSSCICCPPSFCLLSLPKKARQFRDFTHFLDYTQNATLPDCQYFGIWTTIWMPLRSWYTRPWWSSLLSSSRQVIQVAGMVQSFNWPVALQYRRSAFHHQNKWFLSLRSEVSANDESSSGMMLSSDWLCLLSFRTPNQRSMDAASWGVSSSRQVIPSCYLVTDWGPGQWSESLVVWCSAPADLFSFQNTQCSGCSSSR